MVWFIQTREIADAAGNGIEKYRLTAYSDEGGGGPFGLCEHEHDSRESAATCDEANIRANTY